MAGEAERESAKGDSLQNPAAAVNNPTVRESEDELMRLYLQIVIALIVIVSALRVPIAIAADIPPPGHLKFTGGGEIITVTSGAAVKKAMVSRANIFFSKTPEEVLATLRRGSRPQNFWPIRIKVSDQTLSGSVQKLCDQYVRFFLRPQLTALPNRYEGVQLLLLDENQQPQETCEYSVSGSSFTNTESGQTIMISYDLWALKPDRLKEVRVAPLYVENRVDMVKPVQDFLLILPAEADSSVAISAYVDNVAALLYKKYGDDMNLSFTLVHDIGKGQFRALRQRIITVQTPNGFLQLSQIQLRMERMVKTDPDAQPTPKFHVRIDAHSAALQIAYEDMGQMGRLWGGLSDEGYRYMKAVGIFAADAYEVDTVAVYSSAKVGEGARAAVLRDPVIFDRAAGTWNVRPLETRK